MSWKFVINTTWLLLMIVISGLIYVRMAPHDTTALHVPPPMDAAPGGPVIKGSSGLFVQVYDVPPADILETFNTVALASKRTRILAGSIKEGVITYVTRSRILGFPDYTTVQAVTDGQGSRVTIYARLRFGRSDFGVNSSRVRGWLGIVKTLN
ncbi:MAG: hypothetical protein COB39_06240 [Marinosulfonomonas sp.]|nr:MAG: hypothetical protein COB39_06240 [Marinosulfonomonas sp.]